jgi:AcrR family transcriptional regulator
VAEVADRVSRRGRVDKFADRRAELATAALRTLSELGYARTSLREIAQHSGFSHGVLHYYFRDKADLITYCVQQYKAECVNRYDKIVATATTPEQLAVDFGAGLVATLREDAALHRLWYDLRNQSLFEKSYRADVLEIDRSLEHMIWRLVSQYGELSGRPVAVSPAMAYGIFDGLFQQSLLRYLAGQHETLDDLRAAAEQLLPKLVLPG